MQTKLSKINPSLADLVKITRKTNGVLTDPFYFAIDFRTMHHLKLINLIYMLNRIMGIKPSPTVLKFLLFSP